MKGRSRVSVVGLGNVLQGDDAFGPYVVQVLLARYEFPAEVAILDLGTPGLDLSPYLTDVETVIIVDTVRSPGKPGELRLYRKADILRHPPPPRLSPHDPGLEEALLLAEFMGRGPREVLLVGAVPDRTGTGLDLTPALRVAVEQAAGVVVAELLRLGVFVNAREHPGQPAIWWESGPHPPLAWP